MSEQEQEQQGCLSIATPVVVIVFASVTLIASLVTLCFIRRFKTLSYLQCMTVMISIVALFDVYSAGLNLYFCNNNYHQSLLILDFAAYDVQVICIFAINWFISFKFWETVGRLSAYLKSTLDEPDD